jgi:uncharacterized protein (DUF885 family)
MRRFFFEEYSMNSRIVVGLAAVLLGACAAAPPPPPAPAPPAPPPPTPDQQFEALARSYLDEYPRLKPVDGTALGDHRYDDRLDDVSAAGRQAQLDFAQKYLAALDPIDRAALARANQVDARLLRHELEYQRWRIATLEEWRWNPLLYTSLAGDALYTLIARDFAPQAERLANLGKRLEQMPRFLAQERDVLDPQRVPKIHAETAVRQNAGLISMLDGEISARIATLPATEQQDLRAGVARARSALSQHQIWLEKKLAPEAQGDFRLGEKLYDEKLAYALFSPLSRQEIRTRAQAELAATRAAMYDIARQVLKGRRGAPPLPEKPSEPQQQRAIRAALEMAAREHPPRDGVLAAARDALADTTNFVRDKQLVSLPDEPVEIVEMPAFKQGIALAYCDSPGPLDAGQKTFYAVSPIPDSWTRAQTESFLREYNSRSIRNLTVHEAMPGHYLQLAHSNRYPSTLRAVLGSGPFIEGWAVYAERLMTDHGYGDPLMKLVQLKWYLRSIINALLDQAVHVDGISRAAAMQLLTETGFQEEREAAGKWTRAQLTSAQLPVYFVGAQEHFALRAEAEQRAGAAFQLKQYHDRLLSFGSPPVRFARELLFDLPIE